jgi:hypothetical protein
VYLDDAVVTGRALVRSGARSVLDEYVLHYGAAPPHAHLNTGARRRS